MLDYLVANLDGSSNLIEPNQNTEIQGIQTSYIKLDNGIVIIVDDKYENNTLEILYEKAVRQTQKAKHPQTVSLVFLKDGKTFFRSAAQNNRWKSQMYMSLKDYSDEEINRIITFRPEEEFARSQNRESRLQYYQLESERLKESVVTYKFVPVTFDYSHIPSNKRFGPMQVESRKLRIWNQTLSHSGKLRLDLDSGLLIGQ